MRACGFALVVLAILAVAYGGIRYGPSRQELASEGGPRKAAATHRTGVPLWPIVGGVALISGIAFLAAPRKRDALGWIEANTQRPTRDEPTSEGPEPIRTEVSA